MTPPVKLILIFMCVIMIVASGGYIWRAFQNTFPGNNVENEAYLRSTNCGFNDATDPTTPCVGSPATITAKRAEKSYRRHSGTEHWAYFATVRKSDGKAQEVGGVREDEYANLREGMPVTAVTWKNHLVGLSYDGGIVHTDDIPGLEGLKSTGFKVACGFFIAGVIGLQILSYRRRRLFGIW